MQGWKAGFARHNFARTIADVDSPSQMMIPMVDGRVLMRLASSFEEDYKIVSKNHWKQLSRCFGDVLTILEPSGPGRRASAPYPPLILGPPSSWSMPRSGYLEPLSLIAFRWHDLLHFVALMIFLIHATKGPGEIPVEEPFTDEAVNSAVVKT